MEFIKLKLHSVVDLITNSSTVIYTYTDTCPNAIRDLIEELSKVFGFTETVDDMFYMGSFLDDNDHYLDYLYELDDDIDNPELVDMKHFSEIKDDYKDCNKFMESLYMTIMKDHNGKKPKWMLDCEEGNGYSSYGPSTSLIIIPKDEKYNKLGESLKKLAYSIDCEAEYDS